MLSTEPDQQSTLWHSSIQDTCLRPLDCSTIVTQVDRQSWPVRQEATDKTPKALIYWQILKLFILYRWIYSSCRKLLRSRQSAIAGTIYFVDEEFMSMMILCLPGLQYVLPHSLYAYWSSVSSPIVVLLSLVTTNCSATLLRCRSRENSEFLREKALKFLVMV